LLSVVDARLICRRTIYLYPSLSLSRGIESDNRAPHFDCGIDLSCRGILMVGYGGELWLRPLSLAILAGSKSIKETLQPVE